MIPTAEELLVAQHKPAAIGTRILGVLKTGPMTALELSAEIESSHKNAGTALARLESAGLVKRLWKIDPERFGGPMPQVWGLAWVDYLPERRAGPDTLRNRIMLELAEGQATSYELATVLDHPAKAVGATILDLIRDGKVRRVARAPKEAVRGGSAGWIYALGAEGARIRAAPPRKPDPARIAGHTYHRELAGWGVWR